MDSSFRGNGTALLRIAEVGANPDPPLPAKERLTTALECVELSVDRLDYGKLLFSQCG